MKKIFTLPLLFLLFLFAGRSAEGQTYQQGTNIMSAGLSFGSSLTMGSTTRSPMVSVRYERAVLDLNGSGIISVGGYGAYNVYFFGADKFSYTIIGLRSAYHLSSGLSGNADFYGGMMASYDFRGGASRGFQKQYMGVSGSDLYRSKFDFMPFIGARFFINDNMAIFTEFSYGSAFVSCGLAWIL